MKSILLILTLLFLASCDGGGSGSSESKKTDPVMEGPELSKEELALKNRLVSRGFYDQRELAKELAQTKEMNKDTLTKLDAYIDMDCSIGGGCSIYSKE